MRVAHRLAPLVSGGVPERHVILDTEAERKPTRAGEVQTFALACAEYLRCGADGQPELLRAADYYDPRELWLDVAAFTRNRHRTIVWCHGLAYDLRISRALAELPALGLALAGIVIDAGSSWATFRGGHRTVACVDLASWLPTTLAKIGQELGESGGGLLRRVAAEDQLLHRCRRDVEITRGAVVQLLALVRGENLGPWRQTGAGQSHSAWRRRFLDQPPVVHDDTLALAAERRAMWTGRCEAWRWGRIAGERLVEYDAQLAYARIAASCALPARLVGRMAAGGLQAWLSNRDRHALLAEVEVRSERELVPTEHGRFIHWPVGTFTTTLWDPELALLLDRGACVRVRRSWLYERAPVLAAAAGWLLDQLAHTSPGVTAVQRRALKHMSRTLVGRCALRYRSWEHFGHVPDFQLRLGELHDLDTGEQTELLHVGHDLLTLGEQTEAEDSLPQITGWVMSEARARLWQLIELAGPETVLYMDTDSLVVSAAGAEVLDAAIDAGAVEHLNVKGTYREARILGPRQLQLGRSRRLAGVPLSAVRRSPGTLDGEVWRSLRESLSRGEGGSVVLEHKRWQLQAVDNRRDHLAAGATAPHRVG